MADRVRVVESGRQVAGGFCSLRAALASLLALILLVSSNCVADPMDLDLTGVQPMEVDEAVETFYDASEEINQLTNETYYDAEEEINYDEDVEANVCITAGKGECRACCVRSELNNAFWDRQSGQCLCYGQIFEEGLCTESRTARLCEKCCSEHHYLRGNFDSSGRSVSMCTCLLADMGFYLGSFL